MLLSHMLLNIVCAPLSHFWLQHPEMTLCHAAFEIRITLQNRQQCDVDLNMSGMVLTGLLSWLSAAIASKLQQHIDLDATAEASTEQQICSPSERWIPTECCILLTVRLEKRLVDARHTLHARSASSAVKLYILEQLK